MKKWTIEDSKELSIIGDLRRSIFFFKNNISSFRT